MALAIYSCHNFSSLGLLQMLIMKNNFAQFSQASFYAQLVAMHAIFLFATLPVFHFSQVFFC